MKKYLIAAVALFVLALDANAQCSCGGGNASATIASSEAAAKSGTQVATYKALQMHCGGCASKVKKALKADSGYKDVAINTETKDIVVAYDKSKTTPEKLAADIKAAGYTPEEQK